MKFRTEYEASKAPFTLDPDKPIVLVGSCFSQNIAKKMEDHSWKAVNPLGTLYNPLSICLAIDMMLDTEKGMKRFERSLFQANGVWNSENFDSSFSSKDKDDCLDEFKIRRRIFDETLREGGMLIVTFGTSICYYTTEKRLPVGNCHKQPSNLFYTQRMTPSQILSYWEVVNENLESKYPGLKTIFTVSPVRHLKDGFVGNARSKAVLLLGIEDICSYVPGSFYFPAYEILNDDLRDYRFYASDLAHPSEEAIDYIWEKFKDTFIDREGHILLNKRAAQVRASLHRPLTGALGKPLV